jgi:hypothetical protein
MQIRQYSIIHIDFAARRFYSRRVQLSRSCSHWQGLQRRCRSDLVFNFVLEVACRSF